MYGVESRRRVPQCLVCPYLLPTLLGGIGLATVFEFRSSSSSSSCVCKKAVFLFCCVPLLCAGMGNGGGEKETLKSFPRGPLHNTTQKGGRETEESFHFRAKGGEEVLHAGEELKERKEEEEWGSLLPSFLSGRTTQNNPQKQEFCGG